MTATTIKVASFNIRKGVGLDRQRDPARIVDILREIDADIVALQEADRRFGARARVIPGRMLDDAGWRAAPVALRPASMGWHGNAILVRRDAIVGHSEAIHLPALEPRGAVAAEVTTPLGRLRVVGMHLDLSGLWRRRQAGAILAHLRSAPPMPTVMMGDLNEWRPNGGCLGDFARHFAFAPTGASFHARRPVARLDRIMASAPLSVVDAGVHGSIAARIASDHLPIWATLALG